MRPIMRMLGIQDQEPQVRDEGESSVQRFIPTKEQAIEDIRYFNRLLEPAFVAPGFLTPSQDPMAGSPLELLAVQEQGLLNNVEGDIAIRQITDADLDAGRTTNETATGTARGVYQRELPATIDAVNQLRKQPWMLDNAFDAVMDSSDPRDLEDLQFLSQHITSDLNDEQVAKIFQDESTRAYNPLLDTILHLAYVSRGTAKPAAYSRLQDNHQPSHSDVTTIQRQKGGTTQAKQRMLDRYVSEYILTYSDSGER